MRWRKMKKPSVRPTLLVLSLCAMAFLMLWTVQRISGAEANEIESDFSPAASVGEGVRSSRLIARDNDTPGSLLPPFIATEIDADLRLWTQRVREKLLCLQTSPANMAFYHYHVRKAAGTTIRDVVKAYLARDAKPTRLRSRGRVRDPPLNTRHYVETEGAVLDRDILALQGLFSLVSLRDPVSRIVSLYWYEHVGWYAGVLKQPERCKSLRDWVQAWLDGASFKTNILKRFPGNNYIEIENYYVKMLSGHRGSGGVGREDLERAKETLRQFDLVLVTEWMGDETQLDVINALFPGRDQISPGHKVRGDFRTKERLGPTLAADEAEIRELLTERNQLDLELFEYAQSLTALRLKYFLPLLGEAKQQAQMARNGEVGSSLSCNVTEHDANIRNSLFRMKFKNSVGIFQPPGHKGPF